MKFLLYILVLIMAPLGVCGQDSSWVGLDRELELTLPAETTLQRMPLQGEQNVWIRFWKSEPTSDSQWMKWTIAFAVLDTDKYDLRNFIEFTPEYASPIWVVGESLLEPQDSGIIRPSTHPWTHTYRSFYIPYLYWIWAFFIFWGISLPAFLIYRYLTRERPLPPPPPTPQVPALDILFDMISNWKTEVNEVEKVRFLMAFFAAFAEVRQLPEMRVERLIYQLRHDPLWGKVYDKIEYALFESENGAVPQTDILELIATEREARSNSL